MRTGRIRREEREEGGGVIDNNNNNNNNKGHAERLFSHSLTVRTEIAQSPRDILIGKSGL